MEWEYSILIFYDNGLKHYKITRRLIDMSVAETKVYTDKNRMIRQLSSWLG